MCLDTLRCLYVYTPYEYVYTLFEHIYIFVDVFTIRQKQCQGQRWSALHRPCRWMGSCALRSAMCWPRGP